MRNVDDINTAHDKESICNVALLKDKPPGSNSIGHEFESSGAAIFDFYIWHLHSWYNDRYTFSTDLRSLTQYIVCRAVGRVCNQTRNMHRGRFSSSAATRSTMYRPEEFSVVPKPLGFEKFFKLIRWGMYCLTQVANWCKNVMNNTYSLLLWNSKYADSQ